MTPVDTWGAHHTEILATVAGVRRSAGTGGCTKARRVQDPVNSGGRFSMKDETASVRSFDVMKLAFHRAT